MLSAALEYASVGWFIFPLHHPIRGRGDQRLLMALTRCSCGKPDCSSPAKHPRTRNGLNDASTDPEQVRAWWHRWRHANIGISTGPSRLVVLDVDGEPGAVSLARLEAAFGVLPATLTVRTGRGVHRYFAAPAEEVRNTAGALGDGLDIRGAGGYTVAPPSRHASGRVYEWVDPAAPVAPVPAWILDALRPAPAPSRPKFHVIRSGTRYALAALDREAAAVRATPPGSRNARLNRASFALGQLVAAGAITPELAANALLDAARGAGLGEREARSTILSGLNAGAAHPRQGVGG